MYLKLRLWRSACDAVRLYTFICGLRTGSRGDSALSQSPSQSQSSSAIHARGRQTTQDPSTHYNRVISAGCVEAGWRLSLSSVEASDQSESERVLSNLSKMLEMRNSPSLPTSFPSSLRRDHPFPSRMHSTQSNEPHIPTTHQPTASSAASLSPSSTLPRRISPPRMQRGCGMFVSIVLWFFRLIGNRFHSGKSNNY